MVTGAGLVFGSRTRSNPEKSHPSRLAKPNCDESLLKVQVIMLFLGAIRIVLSVGGSCNRNSHQYELAVESLGSWRYHARY